MLVRTTQQHRKMLSQAAKRSRGSLRAISLVSSHKTLIRRTASITAYLRNLNVKIDAIHRAKKHLGMRPVLASRREAMQLNLYLPCQEEVGFYLKAKTSGDFRTIFRFDVEHAARQLIMDDLLKACFPIPDWQYDQKGRGRDKAIDDIVEAIIQGKPYFAVLDIADCFQSFDGDRMAEILSLPEEIVRNNITADNLNCMLDHSICGSNITSHHTPQSRQLGGLPQGSIVSNRVAAIMMSNLHEILRSNVSIFMYRDDIVLLAETRNEIDASVLALNDALANHRSGCLRLKRCDRGFIDDKSIDFLGYNINCQNTKVIVSLSDKNKDRLISDWNLSVKIDIALIDEKLSRTTAFINQKRNGFRAADDDPIWAELADISQELVRQEKQVAGVGRIVDFQSVFATPSLYK